MKHQKKEMSGSIRIWAILKAV